MKIMTVVPYMQKLTEPIKCVLQQVGVGVAMKPVCVLSKVFVSPKTKFWTKKSWALFIKYLLTATQCTSVKQAKA